MNALLRQLRFDTYRLEVLNAAPPSVLRDASILSAVSDIEQALQGIRSTAATPDRRLDPATAVSQ